VLTTSIRRTGSGFHFGRNGVDEDEFLHLLLNYITILNRCEPSRLNIQGLLP
jgi:hypothetical protein